MNCWTRKMKTRYKSKFEARVAAYLRKNGVRFKYEYVVLPYRQLVKHAVCDSCGCKSVSRLRKYLPDFVLPGERYLESKGNLDVAQRQKFIALMVEGYDIKLIFQRNNRISRTSGTTYLEWAKQYGIEACVFPNIPKEWLI